MHSYKRLIEKVWMEGELSGDRTGTGTRKIFGEQLKFNCAHALPVVTIKYTHTPAIIHELLWFITGDTNIKYLRENKVKIWEEWADDFGEIGPMYGTQWRNSGGTYQKTINGMVMSNGVDQLQKAIDDIKNNPNSRRIVIDCWDPKVIPDAEYSPQENVGMGKMALAPCHMFMQFQVTKQGYLNMVMYQRSVDSFLGLPFNITSYAILLSMIAQVTGTTPGMFTWMGGDIHLYNNHINQVEEMLGRHPKNPPTLWLNPVIDNIEDFTFEDIRVLNYEYHPAIKGEISV
jgi:thymidylate synthase